MVVISLKGGEGDGFLFETTTTTPNETLIETLVEIQNLRLRSKLIIASVRDLVEYGPYQSDLEEIEEKLQKTSLDAPVVGCKIDPLGKRVGVPPSDEETVKMLLDLCLDLEKYVDKSQVQNRVAIDKETLEEKIAQIRGGIVALYPDGLPEDDLVKIALDGVSLENTNVAKEVMDPLETSLWSAGKEFQRGQLLSDRLGTNEKTKIICKFQTKGSGAPTREPIVNEKEREAMMAHYFKRQEELKKLAEAEDDDYLNSQWADSKGMKKSLQGLSSIKAPGLRF